MRTQIKSESDAAYLLRNQYGHLIRYIPEWEKWIVFDGKIWSRDDALHVDGLIRELLDGHHGIDARWKGSLNVVRNVKGFAVRDTALHVSAAEIDADPLLLGIKSGVHSLRRHRPISARRKIYVVKRTSVDPDFGKVPKRWIAFVEEICRGDKAKVRYLQRWFGYCLSGSVEEHTLLIIYGPGGNGKGVLVNTVATIMGTYHREAAAETFVENKARAHDTAMAHIAGARLVTSSETDQGGSWNEATMKRAVAGDPVTARFLYKNPFTYRPTFKVCITTNHLPRLKSVGPSMRRRIHLLELDYVPGEPDLHLEEKLREEHGAILAWMMEGAKQWRKQGLNPPKSITRATDDYFAEQDTLGTWLRECTNDVEGAKTPTASLCASYNRFLRSRNVDEMNVSHFGRELRSRGYERAHKGKARTRCFVGIRLKANT